MKGTNRERSEGIGLGRIVSTAVMLAVFDRTVAKSPEGLRNPEAGGGDAAGRRLVDHFAAAREGAVVINLGSAGALAYASEKQNPLLPRWVER